MAGKFLASPVLFEATDCCCGAVRGDAAKQVPPGNISLSNRLKSHCYRDFPVSADQYVSRNYWSFFSFELRDFCQICYQYTNTARSVLVPG